MVTTTKSLEKQFPRGKACENKQRFEVGPKDHDQLSGALYIGYKDIPSGATGVKVVAEFTFE